MKFVKILKDAVTIGYGVRMKGDIVVDPPKPVQEMADGGLPLGKHGIVVEKASLSDAKKAGHAFDKLGRKIEYEKLEA